MGKSITAAVVTFRSDGRAFKPTVAASYISYFKRVLKLLKLDSETFFEITDVSELKKIKAKLLRSPAFKSIAKSSQDHLSSTFGKYIRYIENLNLVENLADTYIKSLTLYFYQTGLNSDKKGLVLMIKKLSFIGQSELSPPKFNNTIGKYIDIKSEKEFKLFCRLVSKFHADKFYQIILLDPKLTSKILALIAHLKFLKSKV